MISAIIEAAGGALLPTFASLTFSVADGLVRDVIVVDPEEGAEVAALADDAGARAVAAAADALAAARQNWLLLLRAGTRLESGWSSAASRHVRDHPDRGGWFRLGYRGGWPRAQAEEASAAMAAALFGRLRAEHGLLAPRRLLESARAGTKGLWLPLRLDRARLHPIEARILAEL